MFSLINIFWLFSETKYILFWVYLWQLKDYHVPRFLDHFRTHKGRQLVLNPLSYIKIVLLLLFFASSSPYPLAFTVLFAVYLLESALFARAILKNSVKKPVKTGKTLFLFFASFVVAAMFLVAPPRQLLIFDILTPLIVSAIVMVFQPIFVFGRDRILKQAAEKREKFKNLTVIGITGSYGKTSTKEFLATILSAKFRVAATKEHQNSEIGVANCILNDLKPETQIFIAEIGAYDKGKVKEVCQMAQPKIGIVTGVNEQHLALFGSMENLLWAEGGRELAESLPKGGLLAVNGQNKYCLDLLKFSNNLPPEQEKIYALNKNVVNADIWTEDIAVKKDSVSFLALNKKKEMGHFKANVLGKQNVQNLLGAILVASELGMSFEEISGACQNIKPEQAGMVLKQGKLGINIIDSSYSANPDGVFADLEYLTVFSNKKAVIMPCLIELGPKSAEIHQKIGKKIAEICSLAIITTKDKFEDLRKGAIDAGMKQSNILYCDNPEEISTIVSLFCKSGDAVLLEGRVPAKLVSLLAD